MKFRILTIKFFSFLMHGTLLFMLPTSNLCSGRIWPFLSGRNQMYQRYGCSLCSDYPFCKEKPLPFIYTSKHNFDRADSRPIICSTAKKDVSHLKNLPIPWQVTVLLRLFNRESSLEDSNSTLTIASNRLEK